MFFDPEIIGVKYEIVNQKPGEVVIGKFNNFALNIKIIYKYKKY